MKKKNFWANTLIVGLALFSTMFGAGNLIFPPQIGLFSGDQWVWGALGLLLGGIVLPVLALWAVNQRGREGPESDGPRVLLVLQHLLPHRLLLHRHGFHSAPQRRHHP